MRTCVSLIVLAATALGAAAAPAWASFPGGNGNLVFQSNRAGGQLDLYLMDEGGTDVRRLTFDDAQDRMPRFSPDGRTVVFASDRDGDFDLYLLDVETRAVTQLTDDPERDDNPAFTADGAEVVWQRGPFLCPCSIWAIRVAGGDMRRLDTGPGNAMHPDPSPRGRALLFASDRDGSWSIHRMQVHGGKVNRVTSGAPGAFGDFRPRWSPTGRDLVFLRDDGTNQNDVWVVHQDGSEATQLTSGPRLEEFANFSPDGSKIVFAVFEGAGARLHTAGRDGSGERVLPQQASPFHETFDGAALQPWRWWQQIAGPGGSIELVGGRAELALSADAANDPARGWMGPHFGTECRAVGDYQASYVFELLEWPPANGTHLLLGDGGATGSIARISDVWFDGYLAFFNPLLATAVAPDRAGAMRLVREGPSLTASYAAGSSWVPLLSAPASVAPATVGPHLFSTDDLFADRPVRVAVDDFTVVADAFACPSWWRDSGPDWAPAPH